MPDNDELDPKNFIITDCKTFKNNTNTNRSNSLAISKIEAKYQKKYVLNIGRDHPVTVEPFDSRQSGVMSVLSKNSGGGASSKRKVMHKALSQMSSFVDSQKINKTFKEDHGTVQKI